MTASVPAALKSADVQRFVQRANQLEKASPVVAYWCRFWALNQVVPKKLHLLNDETTAFTSDLMDKLEKAKSEINEDAISDDTVAQAYVEQFGSETFQRAENAQRANAVTRQTADTFLAAATFFDVCKTWGALSEDIASKAKFAKYHALRIAKAIQAGEDPNATNPAPEPAAENDVEMHDQPIQSGPQQPYVEEVPDEHDNLESDMARQSMTGQSLHPSRAPSATPQAREQPPNPIPPSEDYYQDMRPDVSPLVSPAADQDFFPHNANPEMNSVPSLAPQPSAPNGPSANAFRSFPPPNIVPAQPPHDLPDAPSDVPQQPQAPRYPTRQAAAAPSRQPQPAPRAPPQRSQPPPPQMYNNDGAYRQDDESIVEATRHARFAVSALNFEDVRTAVKELQLALNTLGAR